MSRDYRHKQEKDRALARQLVAKDGDLPKRVLITVYKPAATLKTSATLEAFAFLRRMQAHADQAIVQYLVGVGFLRPKSDINSRTYTLTQKGRALLAD